MALINLEKITSYTTDIVNCQNSPAKKILGYSVSLASFLYLLVLPAYICATAFLQNFGCFTSSGATRNLSWGVRNFWGQGQPLPSFPLPSILLPPPALYPLRPPYPSPS